MTIPTGPYPAAIDYADIVTGMRVRVTGTYADGFSSISNDGWVLSVSSSTLRFAGGGPTLAIDGSTDIPGVKFDHATFELMEAFTGDAAEPSAGSAVQGVDGTVYQRVADPSDPTNSVWYATNSTTSVTWTDITATGTPTTLLDGSTS